MTEPTNNKWVPCPPGELSRLATRLRRRRRGRAVLTAAAALMAAGGVSGVVWLAVTLASHARENNQGPCHPAPTPCSTPADTPPPCPPP